MDVKSKEKQEEKKEKNMSPKERAMQYLEWDDDYTDMMRMFYPSYPWEGPND